MLPFFKAREKVVFATCVTASSHVLLRCTRWRPNIVDIERQLFILKVFGHTECLSVSRRGGAQQRGA